jgi:glyoxylase I family protein
VTSGLRWLERFAAAQPRATSWRSVCHGHKGIFHVNVNCTDFERSLAFYQVVGFTVVLDLAGSSASEYRRGLGLPTDSRNRAALLMLDPQQPRSARLDLIEWIHRRTHGSAAHRPPSSDLAHVGFARIALWTIGLDAEYDRLRSAGIEFISEPVIMPAGDTRFCCFYDPDGTVLELIEFMR